jgi:hypothetical protein
MQDGLARELRIARSGRSAKLHAVARRITVFVYFFTEEI